mmetsp:Transcript_54210/g.80872  ORF Transcript_54210/g.80872 Transcript_54210/m.80872 type:complete len:677 (-) Transcript_54210:992-3022(-)
MMDNDVPSKPSVRVAHKHRILLYTACYNVLDGVTLTIRKIEQEILKAGHSVLVLTTKSGDPKNTHLDGQHPNRQVVFLDNSIEIPFLTDPNNPALSYHLGFSISNRVKRLICEFDPTLIHITVPDCINIHLIEFARKEELPIMGTYHSNIPEYMTHYRGLGWLKHVLGQFFRHQYNFLQRLYVPTPFIVGHLEEAWELGHATDLRVWGRGIDLDKFHPQHLDWKWRKSVLQTSYAAEETSELGLDDIPILLWVGRLVPEKRVDIFCAIVRRLVAMGVKFQAVVIGAGPSTHEVLSLPQTTYLGWQGPDQLKVAYASSDVFLFPSAVETFGNVTLEAAASGLPLVVEKGCSGHLVEDGVNGYACSTYDDFLQGTTQLLESHVLRRRFSHASRKHSLQYEKTKVVRMMIDNYAEVTDEFYETYGGHHANRDAVYVKDPLAFRGGTHPRPFVLMLIEHLFVIVFQTLWYLASGFLWFQEHLTQRIARVVPAPSAAGSTHRVKVSKPDISGEEGDVLSTIEEEGALSDSEDPLLTSIAGSESSTTASTASLSHIASVPAPTREPNHGFCDTHVSPCCIASVKGWLRMMFFLTWMESRLRTYAGCPARAVNRAITWSCLRLSRKRKDSAAMGTAGIMNGFVSRGRTDTLDEDVPSSGVAATTAACRQSSTQHSSRQRRNVV